MTSAGSSSQCPVFEFCRRGPGDGMGHLPTLAVGLTQQGREVAATRRASAAGERAAFSREATRIRARDCEGGNGRRRQVVAGRADRPIPHLAFLPTVTRSGSTWTAGAESALPSGHAPHEGTHRPCVWRWRRSRRHSPRRTRAARNRVPTSRAVHRLLRTACRIPRAGVRACGR